MIALTPASFRLPENLLTTRGSFVWWYLDLVDATGDGLVLIWSFGLPFLPGQEGAARRGRAPRAAHRPSLNVAVYERHELVFYLLQEYAPEDAEWRCEEDRWRFGESVIERSQLDGRIELRATLDCPVPGGSERLRGHVALDAVARRDPSPLSSDGSALEAVDHLWTPLVGPGTAEAKLSYGDTHYRLYGRGYHDQNGGKKPLHALGISRWLWGRLPLDDRELIYFVLWGKDAAHPEVLVVSVDEDGHTQVWNGLEVQMRARRRNLGGLEWFEVISIHPRLGAREDAPRLFVEHATVVDSGPFYMRYLTQAWVDGQPVRGVGEWIAPDRVDLDLHRPLVRMRVDCGANSMWLPLFCGPREGRLKRLVRHASNRLRGS